MTDTPLPTGFIPDYLQPGMRVWCRIKHLNDKGRLIEKLYGSAGDVTYQGYTQVANATFLVFDRVEGAGRKAKAESFAINAAHCPYIGPYVGI